MVSSKSFVLSALLCAGLAASRAFEVRTCAAERAACAARCDGQDSVDFDCDETSDGFARAFACACGSSSGAARSETSNAAPTTEPPQQGPSNPLADESYCDVKRIKCISICASIAAKNTTQGDTAEDAPFPAFSCDESRTEDGMSFAVSSSCFCSGAPNATEIANGPSAESMDSPNAPCAERQARCESSCPSGSTPDFSCESSGDESLGSFSIASACSCVEGVDEVDGVIGAQDAAAELQGKADATKAGTTNAAESAAFESGYKAGAKFAVGYVMSALALVEAVAVGVGAEE